MKFLFGCKNKEILEKMRYSRPDAAAWLKGDAAHKNLKGLVCFYQLKEGVVLRAEISGLPVKRGKCPDSIFAFHIHEGKSCTGTMEEPFADTKNHYNPETCPHPEHAGDLPPLFANSEGYAWQAFYTERFNVKDILGRTVIIHEKPDDFTSQPSGNSGKKIACGIIKK